MGVALMVYVLRRRASTTSVVTNGLILYLDASLPESYPGTGTRWFDLSGQDAHADAVSMPTHVNDNARSYFDFNGTSHRFSSVNINQEYRDLFIVQRLSASNRVLPMVFARFDGQDASLRYEDTTTAMVLRATPDLNDWHINENARVFINGSFSAVGVDILNQDKFIRAFRSNNGGNFASSFRYQISSQFINRYFGGRLYLVLCYNRLLSNEEVNQNFNALRGRFAL